MSVPFSGTDEKAIIEVLSRRSNDQRQQIKNMFKTMYGKVCAVEPSSSFRQLPTSGCSSLTTLFHIEDD